MRNAPPYIATPSARATTRQSSANLRPLGHAGVEPNRDAMLVPRHQLAEPIARVETSSTYKKATTALDEAARARMWGPIVSGTTPSPGREDVDDGLVVLIDELYNGSNEDAVAKEAVAPRPAEWKETLHAALAEAAVDAVAARICAEAERAVLDAGPDIVGVEGIRKRVVKRLRARGFDAGLCRSSWERNTNVSAGSHEYVDVVLATSWSTSRYIVEVNVAAEFEIARPSAEYQGLLRSLPRCSWRGRRFSRRLQRQCAPPRRSPSEARACTCRPGGWCGTCRSSGPASTRECRKWPC